MKWGFGGKGQKSGKQTNKLVHKQLLLANEKSLLPGERRETEER